MSFKSLNQKGVSAVEGLLVVLIVAVIGGTGYYVYNANKNANHTYQSANNSGTPKYSSKKKAATNSTNTQSSSSASSSAEVQTKAAADSQTPAAGGCSEVTSSVVTFTLNPDVPDPRCSRVKATQTLAIKNNNTASVTITLGGKSVTIEAGQTGKIDDQFGTYLEPGVHVMKTTATSGGAPEIWLQ